MTANKHTDNGKKKTMQTASDEISSCLADRKREAVKTAFLFPRLTRLGSAAPRWRPKIASRDSSGRSRR